jgi:hypothetical protein
VAYVDPTKYLQISRDAVKIAIEKNEKENFRIYTILRQANISRGEFFVGQLAGMLSNKIDPSNRKKLIHNLYSKLNKSIFFEHIEGNKFRIVSQKKILIKHKGNSKTTVFRVPLCTVSSRQRFRDIIIGLYIGTGKSNETASKAFNCSVRRIQLATARNHKAGLILKQIRRKIEVFETLEEAREAKDKCQQIGIITSNAFSYKRGYAISVGHTNSYSLMFSRRYKGIKTRKKHKGIITCATTQNWTRPAFTGAGYKYAKQYFEKKYKCKFLEFNHKYDTLDNFVSRYADIYA